VQLDQVEGFDAQVGTRAVGPGAEVVEGVVPGLLWQPAAHLGRDGELWLVLDERADDLLAAAVAVDVRGVDEGHAGVHGRAERAERVLLADAAPVGAELPGPEADHADGASQAGKAAIFHIVTLVRPC
jgi:hypothetical protein